MFGKSKDEKSADEPQAALHLNVMPGEFYGGQNPVIAYKQEIVEAPELKAPPAPPSAVPPSASTIGLFKHTKLFIIAGAVMFVAAMAGVSWYYIRQAQPSLPSAVPAPPASPSRAAAPPTPAPSSTTATSTEAVVATTSPDASTPVPALGEAPPEWPRKIFSDSVDLDGDSLTDAAEELFTTDSGVYDTDGDGYYDGQEVVNLYNPKGQAPVKLIDSGLVSDYVNPTWQYRVYYPSGWAVAGVDPGSNQVLFSAITGDYVEVRAFPKQPGESFDSWFGRTAAGERFTDLVNFSNRFSVEGTHRDDNLVAYFDTGAVVYVMLYHPGNTSSIPFRQVMEMMAQSFRPAQNLTALPAQSVLPAPPPESPGF